MLDPDTGEARDELLPLAAAALKEKGCNLSKPSEVAEQKPEAIMQCIQQGLDKANQQAPSNAQRVRQPRARVR